MARDLERVPLGPETDLVQILEQVRADKTPRLIERGGEALAVVVDADEYRAAIHSADRSRRGQERLAFAGVWRDLDADALIASIHRAREEGSRPSDRP